MPVKTLSLFCLLIFSHYCLAEEDKPPSFAFLEYLGSLEVVVNGETLNPIDLDLVADNQQGEDNNDE